MQGTQFLSIFRERLSAPSGRYQQTLRILRRHFTAGVRCVYVRTSIAVALGRSRDRRAQAADAPACSINCESEVTLPSTNTGWDYIKMEPNSSRLFMARDRDGLTVFDVDQSKAHRDGEEFRRRERAAAAAAIQSGLCRDYRRLAAELRSENAGPIERLTLDKNGGLNSGVHDPVTRQVHFITSTRPAEATWYTLDAATGKLLKTTIFPFRKMDDPAVDGAGNLYAPARRDNLILKLDSKTLKESARWPVPTATSPRRAGRLRPSASSPLASATIRSSSCSTRPPARRRRSVPIGDVCRRHRHRRAAQAHRHLEHRRHAHRHFTARARISTSCSAPCRRGPGARMMFMDERNGKLYVVAAVYTIGKPDAQGNVPDEVYHPNTFVVLTYKPV